MKSRDTIVGVDTLATVKYIPSRQLDNYTNGIVGNLHRLTQLRHFPDHGPRADDPYWEESRAPIRKHPNQGRDDGTFNRNQRFVGAGHILAWHYNGELAAVVPFAKHNASGPQNKRPVRTLLGREAKLWLPGEYAHHRYLWVGDVAMSRQLEEHVAEATASGEAHGLDAMLALAMKHSGVGTGKDRLLSSWLDMPVEDSRDHGEVVLEQALIRDGLTQKSIEPTVPKDWQGPVLRAQYIGSAIDAMHTIANLDGGEKLLAVVGINAAEIRPRAAFQVEA